MSRDQVRSWAIQLVGAALLAFGLWRAVGSAFQVGPEWRSAAFTRTLPSKMSFGLGPLLPAWALVVGHVPETGTVYLLGFWGGSDGPAIARLSVLLYPREIHAVRELPGPRERAGIQRLAPGTYVLEERDLGIPELASLGTLVAQDGSARLWKARSD